MQHEKGSVLYNAAIFIWEYLCVQHLGKAFLCVYEIIQYYVLYSSVPLSGTKILLIQITGLLDAMLCRNKLYIYIFNDSLSFET